VAAVTFDNVGKVYADGTRAVSDMDLEIRDGEFMVLVGPSGCGKTTALRMVAGLESISEGVVSIGERVVNHVPSRDRDIAMVFQSYALYPHLTVFDNIAFGLRLRKAPKAEIENRVREAAHVLGLTEFLDRKPRALSGGQRQRVAMGRAIVRQPQAYLMDEPLSNLDAKLRVHMRAEIASLQNDLGVTTIYVTHDQVEAMTMGDRVAVMRKGELQQVAPPQVLYERPVNLFVGGFIGSPAMNLVEATIARDNGNLAVEVGEHRLALSDELLAFRPKLRDYEGKRLVVGIRPENLEDAALEPDTAEDQRLRGVVVLREPLGSEIVAHFTVNAPPALTEDVRELARDVGQESAVKTAAAESEHETVMVGRFGPRSRIKSGDVVDIAVETGALHFFDLDSGLGIYGNTDNGRAATEQTEQEGEET
jgi:multiple sugar transport system ATP-binding protein